LAPGGHLGRFIIWTKDAFAKLNNIFGNYRAKGVEKSGYVLNRNVMTCADLSRIINSDQVQSKLRNVKKSEVHHDKGKKNPLKNRALMKKLNPFDGIRRHAEHKLNEERHKKREAHLKGLRKTKEWKAGKKTRNANFKKLQDGLLHSYQEAKDALADEEALDNMVSSEDEQE